MVNCPQCQHPNPFNARFCNNCAAPLGGIHAARTGGAGPIVGPAIPEETPRKIAWGRKRMAGSSWFGLLFGALFGGIPAVICVAFVVVLLSSSGDPGLWIAVVVLGVMTSVGALIFGVSALKTMVNGRLLKYGTRVDGVIIESRTDASFKVNGKPSQRITWQYTDAEGNQQQGDIQIFDDERIRAHHVGTRVSVLHAGTGLSVVPSLMDIGFEVPPEARDVRQKLGARPPVPTPQSLATSASWRLTTTSPQPRSGCLGRGHRGVKAGALVLTGAVLSIKDTKGSERARIDLGQRFSVGLAAWMLAGDQAEVTLSLVTGGGVGAKPLEVRVRLAQACVAPAVPLQQKGAPYISAADFAALWPVLVYHAGLHGNELRDQLNPALHRKAGPVKTVKPQQPQKNKKPRTCLGSLAGLGFVLFWMVIFPGIFVYVFLFSMKGSPEYECALKEVQSSKSARKLLGKPIKPGTFVFLSSWESGGSSAEGHFSMSVEGPKGQGDVIVDSARGPGYSSFRVVLETDKKTLTIHQGTFPCR